MINFEVIGLLFGENRKKNVITLKLLCYNQCSLSNHYKSGLYLNKHLTNMRIVLWNYNFYIHSYSTALLNLCRIFSSLRLQKAVVWSISWNFMLLLYWLYGLPFSWKILGLSFYPIMWHYIEYFLDILLVSSL